MVQVRTDPTGTIIVFPEKVGGGDVCRVDPTFHCKAAVQADIQAGRGCISDVTAAAVEVETMAYLARNERYAVKHSIISVSNIVGISFARPPAHQSGRRRYTSIGSGSDHEK